MLYTHTPRSAKNHTVAHRTVLIALALAFAFPAAALALPGVMVFGVAGAAAAVFGVPGTFLAATAAGGGGAAGGGRAASGGSGAAGGASGVAAALEAAAFEAVFGVPLLEDAGVFGVAGVLATAVGAAVLADALLAAAFFGEAACTPLV